MKTHVEFQSADFPPYESEEKEINPGRYGKRVAEFLIHGLKQKGFQPSEPGAEDWGWVIPIQHEPFRLWIGCGNYDGSNNNECPDGFLCFIVTERTIIQKLLFFSKVDTSAQVTSLQQAIDEVLSANPAITNKHWWSHKEFNNPSSRITR